MPALEKNKAVMTDKECLGRVVLTLHRVVK